MNNKLTLTLISFLSLWIFITKVVLRDKTPRNIGSISKIEALNKEGSDKNGSNVNPITVNNPSIKEGQPAKDTDQKISLKINFNDKVYGNKNSKVVMIEYAAPTCRHCAYYHKEIFPEIKKKYIDTKKIAYVLRLFITNKLDLDAAVIPYCDYTGDNDRFSQWIDTLLNSQENWLIKSNYLDQLTTICVVGGLPKEKYQKCLQDDTIANILIENNRAALTNAKFKAGPATPAFFINGKKFEENYSAELLSKALDSELKEVEKNSDG